MSHVIVAEFLMPHIVAMVLMLDDIVGKASNIAIRGMGRVAVKF